MHRILRLSGPTTQLALLIVPALLALTGCGAEESATVEETNAAPVVCAAARISGEGDKCNLSFSECDDQHLHELLCVDNYGGIGAYSERLTCLCAEDQATYGSTTLEGFNCSNALTAKATIEAGFRACGRNIRIPASQ